LRQKKTIFEVPPWEKEKKLQNFLPEKYLFVNFMTLNWRIRKFSSAFTTTFLPAATKRTARVIKKNPAQ
jgi:hypothetical protein